MGDVAHHDPDQLIGPVPRHLTQRPVDAQQQAVGRDVHHPDRSFVDRRAQQLLHRLQPRLLTPAIADVAKRDHHQQPRAGLKRTHHGRDWNRGAVPATRVEVAFDADRPGCGVGREPSEFSLTCHMQPSRNEQLDRLTHQLRS